MQTPSAAVAGNRDTKERWIPGGHAAVRWARILRLEGSPTVSSVRDSRRIAPAVLNW
jgi:hypothetical protein